MHQCISAVGDCLIRFPCSIFQLILIHPNITLSIYIHQAFFPRTYPRAGSYFDKDRLSQCMMGNQRIRFLSFSYVFSTFCFFLIRIKINDVCHTEIENADRYKKKNIKMYLSESSENNRIILKPKRFAEL